MDNIETIAYNTGQDFLAGCRAYLMENEIANNYQLGVAPRLKENNILFSVNQKHPAKALLTGLCEISVGSLSLVTYETDEKLLEILTAHVISFLKACPLTLKLIGVTAPESLVHPVREFLNSHFDAGFNFRTNLRCYICTTVSKDALELADRASGSMVVANESHLEEAVNLMREFEEQVHRPSERLSDCYIFPGCDEDSGYVDITSPDSNHIRVLLHHLVLYAYLGSWLYELNEDGEPKIGPYAPRVMDLSHGCHHKACMNPYHLIFELSTINCKRCRVDDEECTCGQTPECILQPDLVTYKKVRRVDRRAKPYSGVVHIFPNYRNRRRRN